jgi:hypothetical protein
MSRRDLVLKAAKEDNMEILCVPAGAIRRLQPSDHRAFSE